MMRPSCCSLILFFTILLSSNLIQGLEEQDSLGVRFWYKSRRVMIGSTMPTCTYNECRACKSKCVVEQIPVEGNDPINNAYHYRCVCHRS